MRLLHQRSRCYVCVDAGDCYSRGLLQFDGGRQKAARPWVISRLPGRAWWCSEQPGTELLLFGFDRRSPSLLRRHRMSSRRRGPFPRDRVTHFRFIQPGAKVLAALPPSARGGHERRRIRRCAGRCDRRASRIPAQGTRQFTHRAVELATGQPAGAVQSSPIWLNQGLSLLQAAWASLR